MKNGTKGTLRTSLKGVAMLVTRILTYRCGRFEYWGMMQRCVSLTSGGEVSFDNLKVEPTTSVEDRLIFYDAHAVDP